MAFQYIDFSKPIQFEQIKRHGENVWAIKTEQLMTDGSREYITAWWEISKEHYTIDQLDDIWRAAKKQGASDEIVKAIRDATFDETRAVFEKYTPTGKEEAIWRVCFPFTMEGSDRIAIAKYAIDSDRVATEYLSKLYTMAIRQAEPDELIRHIAEVKMKRETEVTA